MNSNNKFYQYLARSSSHRIQVALAVVQQAEIVRESPSSAKFSLPSYQQSMPEAYFLLRCAVFWHSTDPSALNDVIRHVSSSKQHASAVLTMLLKKLASPCDGGTKVAILYHMPTLAIDKVSFFITSFNLALPDSFILPLQDVRSADPASH